MILDNTVDRFIVLFFVFDLPDIPTDSGDFFWLLLALEVSIENIVAKLVANLLDLSLPAVLVITIWKLLDIIFLHQWAQGSENQASAKR